MDAEGAITKVGLEKDGRLLADTLALTPSGGKIPREIALARGGKMLFAANQDSDNIAVFEVGGDGELAKKSVHPCLTPVCVVSDSDV